MRNKITGTFIILIFFVEIIFVNPNIDYKSLKDSQNTNNSFEELLPQDANKILANVPKAFTENRGQLENEEVKFYAQGGEVWFSDDGVWFEIREELSINSPESRVQSRESNEWFDPMSKFQPPEPVEYKCVILKQEFVDANPVRPVGREKMGWNSNFFYGNDTSKWQTEVPNYQEIYYENLYDRIDLRYYTNEKGLKYDLIVHPGGNLSQIRIKYKGAGKLMIDDFGNLRIKTKIREIKDGKLFIYQDYSGIRHQVEGRFVLYNNQNFGFEILNNYQKNEVLVIDPLIYSTYIGGINSEQSLGMAIDTFCNVYVIGDTSSVDFPNTTGAYNIKNSGNRDLFNFKLNPTGSSLIYSTYIGGINYDGGSDIAIDSKGYAYITGWTNSSDFPNTTGAYDTSYNGGGLLGGDAFILKLDSTGSSLIYSTFVGGDNDDGGSSITIDSSGNAFISGGTKSFNFPNTTGAFDNICNGGYDTFIIKLSSSGSSLLFSTFIGGTNNDFPGNIAIDLNGCVYMSGSTRSIDFPTTNGVFDSTYNGNGDIYILKLDPTGSYLTYSTFIGGNFSDGSGSGISLDSGENIYITGSTESSDFPTTTGAYDTTYNGDRDIFVLKLNSIGSSILYSTFIGGDNRENSGDIVIDLTNNVYITGNTFSPSFPNTTDAFDNNFNGVIDGFILKLNPAGSSLIYSTFIGGNDSAWESITRLVIDDYCNIYVTGITDSTDFPNTTGAYDNIYNGNIDVFVLKLNIIINNSFPKVLDLQTSKPTVFRNNPIHLYSNATDIEDLEQKLTPFFIEYRDSDYVFWNNSYFSKPVYNNSHWQISFTPPKNAILGLYDFRIMFNDTDQLFSSWFYLNDSLTVLNNIPFIENLFLSKNKAILGNKISVWINGTDIEEWEENLTIELEYRYTNEQSWNTIFFENPFYLNEKWEYTFIISSNSLFGYYDFRVRINDSDGDYSPWLYANDSLLVYNSQPNIIDIKLSNSSVYRTNSVIITINGTDHETLDSMLKLYVQYSVDNGNEWIDLVGKYIDSNNHWEIEFYTSIKSVLGVYDFRARFEDNESASSNWYYLNDSLEVLNNKPSVNDINVPISIVYRTQSIIILINGTDIEDSENLLNCEIQYKSPTGVWTDLNDENFNLDFWEVNITPAKNAELGTYDLRINFIDTDGGYSDWKIIKNVFEVKNNPPIISVLCDDFNIDFRPIEIDLTQYEFDIEDIGENLTWSIDKNTINSTLFSASIIDIPEDILRLIPKNNISGSDNISLILNDKDGGHITKSDVTIFVNSKISHYYNINITIFPNYIEIIQGKSQNVTLTITNIGNLSDNYTIIFESNKFTAGNILFEKNFISLNSGNLKNVNVTISIPKDMKSDEYRITFIVKSDYAIDETILTINVKDSKNEEDNVLVFASIWIIIIFIICLITVSGFYYYSRKKHAKQKPSSPEEILIKSTLDSRQDKTLMDNSTSLNIERPPGSSKADNNAQQMQAAITPTSPLVKPTEIVQTTAPQQIPQVTSQPQQQSTESQSRLAKEILLPGLEFKSIISEKSKVTTQAAELKFTNDASRKEEE